MNFLGTIASAMRNPVGASRVGARFCERLRYRQLGRHSYNPEGIDVFAKDWDNLIILDACRADTFRERVELAGETSSVISRAGATPEWVEANFSNSDLHDVVYVTGNGWFGKLGERIDGEVYEHRFIPSPSESDKFDVENVIEGDTLHLELVTEQAQQAAEEHPDKRLLVHYTSPHRPFIGPTAREELPPYDPSKDKPPGVSSEVFRRAYGESLDRAIDEVQKLLPTLKGRTVLSADHGEMLGERHSVLPVRDYGHYIGIYNSALVRVPWHVIEDGERREIVAERPEENNHVETNVEETLEHLGYKV